MRRKFNPIHSWLAAAAAAAVAASTIFLFFPPLYPATLCAPNTIDSSWFSLFAW